MQVKPKSKIIRNHSDGRREDGVSQARLIDQPWSVAWKEALQELQVSQEKGLDNAEVKKRRKGYGPNRLREAKKKSAWRILAEQFKNPIVALLAVAAIVSFVFGETVDALAIAAVIAINGAIGFVTELRAVRSMEALYRLSRVITKVRRNQHVQELPAEEMVPGDIIILEAGDVVTADCRLIEASKFQADESALTGESVPVGKQVDPIEGDTSLAERTNMLFKGTAVTRGSGEGVVVVTGMATEPGRISALVEEAEEERTPLEKRLDQLGYRLIWVTLAIAGLVGVSGALVGKDLLLMVQTAIALAVATIPEGLPIVATIALARGM